MGKVCTCENWPRGNVISAEFGWNVELTFISNLDNAGSPLQAKVEMTRKQQMACTCAQIMFCTKLRGCLCLNPRPFSEVEIDRTCMFEIRLRTAPEIQMCPVVSTQSKQRAAQCEGRIVGAASCSCWKVHCRAVKREEEDRSAPTMYYSTLHPTASSTPLPTKLHAGLNRVASPLSPLLRPNTRPCLKLNHLPADEDL